MKRRAGALGVAAGLLLALPAPASAVIRCVDVVSPQCAVSHATTQLASNAAADGDTVLIGPGPRPGFFSDDVVTWIGVGATGPNRTELVGPNTDGAPAIQLSRGGELRSLSWRAGSAPAEPGAGLLFRPEVIGDYALTLTDVAGRAGERTANGGQPAGAALDWDPVVNATAAVTVRRATLDGATVASGITGASGDAVSLRLEGATATFEDSTLRGPGNASGLRQNRGAVTLRRTLVEGSSAAVVNGGSLTTDRVTLGGRGVGLVALAQAPVTLSLRNTLVSASDSGASVGMRMVSNAPAMSLTAVGSSIVSAGGGSGALQVIADALAPRLTASLVNTVVQRQGAESANQADIEVDSSDLAAAHSAFETIELTGGATGPVAGAGTNLAAPPQLITETFALSPGSPLVDRGDPAAVVPGELDRNGAPRALDANGDCAAVPDIGAFEVAGAACPPAQNVAPAISAASMTNRVFAVARAGAAQRRRVKRGTRFLYTLSEAATVRIAIERRAAGRRVRGRCRKPTRRNRGAPRCTRWVRRGAISADEQAGAQSLRFSGRIRGRALRPGRHRARITANDAAGAVSAERRLAFRVVRSR